MSVIHNHPLRMSAHKYYNPADIIKLANPGDVFAIDKDFSRYHKDIKGQPMIRGYTIYESMLEEIRDIETITIRNLYPSDCTMAVEESVFYWPVEILGHKIT